MIALLFCVKKPLINGTCSDALGYHSLLLSLNFTRLLRGTPCLARVKKPTLTSFDMT